MKLLFLAGLLAIPLHGICDTRMCGITFINGEHRTFYGGSGCSISISQPYTLTVPATTSNEYDFPVSGDIFTTGEIVNAQIMYKGNLILMSGIVSLIVNDANFLYVWAVPDIIFIDGFESR